MTNFDETRERAILVGIDRPGSPWPVDSSLEELARLVDTAGADVVATTTQRLNAPNPRTFVGSGKAEEIAELCRAHAADLVVFDSKRISLSAFARHVGSLGFEPHGRRSWIAFWRRREPA